MAYVTIAKVLAGVYFCQYMCYEFEDICILDINALQHPIINLCHWCRMHAATKAGTLGAGLILAGAAFYFAEVGTMLKALLTIVFIYLTAPVAAHLIGRAAYRSGIRLYSGTWVDQLDEDMRKKEYPRIKESASWKKR